MVSASWIIFVTMYPDSRVAEECTYTRRNQRHGLKLLSMQRQMITELYRKRERNTNDKFNEAPPNHCRLHSDTTIKLPEALLQDSSPFVSPPHFFGRCTTNYIPCDQVVGYFRQVLLFSLPFLVLSHMDARAHHHKRCLP